MAVLTCHWEGKLKVWWAMKILWVSPIAVVVQAIFLEHLDSKEIKLKKISLWQTLNVCIDAIRTGG